MNNNLKFYLMSATMLVGVFAAPALAADIEIMNLPAVSAINGKMDFGAGFSDASGIKSVEALFGDAAITIPLGERFGLQADFGAARAFKTSAVGGALHLFTRDPGQYLVGAIGGYTDFKGGNAFWGGGEAELYLQNISLEMAAGAIRSKTTSSHKTRLFADGVAAFYPTEDLRLSLGASSVAGFESGGVGMEWLMRDSGLPLSLRGDVRVGENHSVVAKVGFSLYFGGTGDKSLIRRHREDDPRVRSFVGQGGVDILGLANKKNSSTCTPAGGGGGEGALAAKAAFIPPPVDPCAPVVMMDY
jgi:hypothetical protein